MSKNSNTQQINPNFKVYARLRPIEYSQKIMESTDTTISIKEITKAAKESQDKMEFNFHKVFNQNATQEQVFEVIAEQCVQKVMEGVNACVVSYGQTGSGKSYTIFGEDENFTPGNYVSYKVDRRGLVPRTIEYLIEKSYQFKNQKTFQIQCNMYEIYQEQIRDLGKSIQDKYQNPALLLKNSTQSNFDGSNLEIVDQPNGQVMIKNMMQFPIETMNDLNDILQAAFKQRKKLETPANQLSARTHTIFSVTLILKDQRDNLPISNATIQFVDLAGSERIAKNLNEGYKYNQTLLLQNNFVALGKCLLSIAQTATKSIPYKESTLTKSLQNCLQSISHVALIINIHPGDSNHEECLNTLQFSDRAKNLDFKGKDLEEGSIANLEQISDQSDNAKAFKKLNDDLAQERAKIEKAQKDFKNNLQELQRILQLDIDLEKLLTKPSDKDLKTIQAQREAIAELENLLKCKNQLESEIQY